MNRRVKQFLSGFMTACLMAVILPFQTLTAFAANGRIAFSDRNASVGSEIEINMKITVTGGGSLNNAVVMLDYDASMLEFLSGTGASGGAGAIRISIGGDTADATELVSTLKFKGLQAGSTKISVNTQEVYDGENQIVTIDQLGSSAITLTALENASHVASLKELKISPGTLSPEFSADVFRYTANVDADVTKITVSAPAVDEKASVVILGNEELQPGENQVVCKVIAEDGTTTKEYEIAVNRAGAAGEQTPASSIAVVTPAMTVNIIPLDEDVAIPEGFTECVIAIDGQEAQGWIWATDKEHEYCIFYGVNEAGEKGFYRYDLMEKTMQRYFQDPASELNVSRDEYAALAVDYNALRDDYNMRLYIIIALGVVAALLLVAVIVLLTGRKKYDDDDGYGNYEEKLNEKRTFIPREERYQRDLGPDRTERPGKTGFKDVPDHDPDGEGDAFEEMEGQALDKTVPRYKQDPQPARVKRMPRTPEGKPETDEDDGFELIDLDD